MNDKINPSYYKHNGFEVIQLTETLPFNLGNVVKYVARAGKKGDLLEDLSKASWYLQREIERVSSADSGS